jgi:hypothetical protein
VTWRHVTPEAMTYEHAGAVVNMLSLATLVTLVAFTIVSVVYARS